MTSVFQPSWQLARYYLKYNCSSRKKS